MEVRLHIIGDLSDGVEGGVSDLGVGMLGEFENHGDDVLNIRNVVHVLSDLRQAHEGGEGVSPVVVLQHLFYDSGQNDHQVVLPDAFHESVDGTHSEVGVGVVSVFVETFSESFGGLLPFVVDFIVLVNHVHEDQFQYLFLKVVFAFDSGGESLDDKDQGFQSDSFDSFVIDLHFFANFADGLENQSEVVFEKLGFFFRQIGYHF